LWLRFVCLPLRLLFYLLLLTRHIAADVVDPTIAHGLPEHLRVAFLFDVLVIVEIGLFANLAEVEVGMDQVDGLCKWESTELES
jgi:hypothetical protein